MPRALAAGIEGLTHFYMVGSRARGNFQPHKDWDFVIGSEPRVQEHLSQKARDDGYYIDFLCMTPEKAEKVLGYKSYAVQLLEQGNYHVED